MPIDAPTGTPVWRARPQLSPALLNLAVLLWITLTQNLTFWGRVFAPFDGHPVKAAIFAAVIVVFFHLILTLLAVRWLQKPVLVAMLMIGRCPVSTRTSWASPSTAR